jgi:D-amino peptidase
VEFINPSSKRDSMPATRSPALRTRTTLPAFVTAAILLAAPACDGEGEARNQAPGTVLEAPVPTASDGPRILLYHDMEGLSGQDDANTFRYAHPDRYALGRELLTGDVNAVIAGLFDGGARSVDVVDAHGSGSPQPDLILDQLDSRARHIFRDEPFQPYVDIIEAGAWDAVVVVGMHAKTGSRGFASHTFTLGIDFILNGRHITETELIGYSWGRVGVPVIFASGDDRLAADLAPTMPWVEFVTVKTATSASTADLRPIEEARADLREGARRAIQNRDSARSMRLTEPVRAGFRAVPPAGLSVLEGVPGIEFEGEAVMFTTDTFREAYDGLLALVGVARTAYSGVLQETIRSHPEGEALMRTYGDRLFDRWLDYESGRWSPPAPPPPPEGRRYHGVN